MDWISHFRPIFIGATRRKLCFQLLALHKFPVANRTLIEKNKELLTATMTGSQEPFFPQPKQKWVFLSSWCPMCAQVTLATYKQYDKMRAPLFVQPSHVWHIRDTSDASVYNLYTDSFTDRPILWYDTLQRAPEKVFTGEAFIESNWRLAEWAITG